jgi:soluble lytic murein transglycosylase-like protein
MFSRYSIEPQLRRRIADAVISSSRKYDVDPILVASIILVESSGNPFAVSQASSVGIMQVHMPTWASLIEEQGINVFKLEDNVDLGVRILKGYIEGNGIWEGVARYKGMTDSPESRQAAAEYVAKVQGIYGLDPEQASLQQD